MPIAFRHRNDPSPLKPPVQGLAVHRESDPSVMARLQGRDLAEIQQRFDRGHRAYIATIDGAPAAWGWVATTSATIGELRASFTVPSSDRYLWNFVTLSAFRGRGIYPRLLDAIVEAESADAERFWIAYAPENHASGTGIAKAGFTLVADLSFDVSGRPVVREIRSGGGSAAARLVGLPAITEEVAKCWRCAREQKPSTSSCAGGTCSCDYQRAEQACATEAA